MRGCRKVLRNRDTRLVSPWQSVSEALEQNENKIPPQFSASMMSFGSPTAFFRKDARGRSRKRQSRAARLVSRPGAVARFRHEPGSGAAAQCRGGAPGGAAPLRHWGAGTPRKRSRRASQARHGAAVRTGRLPALHVLVARFNARREGQKRRRGPMRLKGRPDRPVGRRSVGCLTGEDFQTWIAAHCAVCRVRASPVRRHEELTLWRREELTPTACCPRGFLMNDQRLRSGLCGWKDRGGKRCWRRGRSRRCSG